MILKQFDLEEQRVTAELEMDYEQEVLRLKVIFDIPHITMSAYKIFEDGNYPHDELGDKLGKLFLCIPQRHLRGIFGILFERLQTETNLPISLSFTKHPGFPAIAVEYNHHFILRDSVQTICKNILDAIIEGEYSSEEKPSDETSEELEDEIPEESVDDDTYQEKPSEWQDDPFELGEIVDKGEDDDE